MKRFLVSLGLVAAMSGVALAQNPNAAASTASAQQGNAADENSTAAGSGQAVMVELMKTLDAKKLKAGDPVTTRLTQGMRAGDGTFVAAGSVVKGHVTAATAKGNGAPQSSIVIAFDNVALKNGQQLPFQATIQAVGAPPILAPEQYGGGAGSQPVMTPPGTPNSPGSLSGTGPMGGSAPVTGLPQPGNPPQTNGNPGTALSPGGLTTESTGVVGLRNIELQSGSTLTSTGKDLKLDSGTELVLRVQGR